MRQNHDNKCNRRAGDLRLIFVKKGGAQERTMLSSKVDHDAL